RVPNCSNPDAGAELAPRRRHEPAVRAGRNATSNPPRWETAPGRRQRDRAAPTEEGSLSRPESAYFGQMKRFLQTTELWYKTTHGGVSRRPRLMHVGSSTKGVGVADQRVEIVEVGLRDGLQMLADVLPTERKVAWLEAEYSAGVRHFEVGSFVPPKLMPQLA